MSRVLMLVVHTGREGNRATARHVAVELAKAGVELRVLADEAPQLDPSTYAELVADDERAAEGTELVLALGGDGTLLRAAELARPAGVPVLGINLGRVGFLTEVDSDAVREALTAVVGRGYHVDERMTVDVRVLDPDGREVYSTWALNEASVEKSSRERVLDVLLEIDGHPVSWFGCDGILCATPTGSTAYAFSAGGPIVWPEVRALLVVPSNAHALFATPLVVSPDSRVVLRVDGSGHPAVLCCDGRRTVGIPPGHSVEVVGGHTPVRLARLSKAPFTDRLVRKFSLPVQSWRGQTL